MTLARMSQRAASRACYSKRWSFATSVAVHLYRLVGVMLGIDRVGWTRAIRNANVHQMPATIGTYPDFLEQVRDLVQQHRDSNKQRLHLAVYFAPLHRGKRDIFIFEVIDGFGGDAVDPERKLFEFAFGSTPALPLAPGTSLRVVLTNPTELEAALRDDWKSLQELREARNANRATVIYADAKGKRLWEQIK